MTVLLLLHFVYVVFTPGFMSNIDRNICRAILTQGVVPTTIQLHQTVKMKRALRSRLDHSRSSDLKKKMNQATTIVRQGERKSNPFSNDPPNCRYNQLKAEWRAWSKLMDSRKGPTRIGFDQETGLINVSDEWWARMEKLEVEGESDNADFSTDSNELGASETTNLMKSATINASAMEVDMETSPSYFDPEDLSTRERYRRYGKRHSTSSHDNSISKVSGTRILYDGQSNERQPNAALFLEDIKQEVESFDSDQLEGTPAKTQSALWRKSLAGSRGVSEVDAAADSIRRPGSYSLKSCKHEDDALSDGGDTTFTLFASLLDSALQGLMPIPDLILQFERSCRNVSESIRYGSNERQRIVEDKLMRQKARLLLDEAASWSLLWYLYGKGNKSLPLMFLS
ncbi:Nuclear pore complex protein NUP107 [Camellia lanceoleosa]|uniref:Nuclear pore complex protein NUP107 n=1 Tax=Camellia lanceoleosa TaxID=1840588 RepID=A0ACC0IIY8_9ERIC|nr:Nuclear pore complex protein NUP107 [Camellia lanceoleosa]